MNWPNGLAPCPICGKQVKFVYDGDYYAVSEFYFHCSDHSGPDGRCADGCGLILPANGTIKETIAIPDQYSLNLWNTRKLLDDNDLRDLLNYPTSFRLNEALPKLVAELGQRRAGRS